MDPRLLQNIRRTVDRLSAGITVLNREGKSLIPDGDTVYPVPEFPAAGECRVQDGRCYLLCTSASDLVLTADDGGEHTRDALYLTDALITALVEAKSTGSDIRDAYRKLLQNELSPAEVQTITDEYDIAGDFARTVLLFYFPQVGSHEAAALLEEYLPVAERDMIVPVDRHTAALLKDVSQVEEVDELKQYAYAVQEEITEDIALQVTIGIGCTAEDTQSLHQSYRQARRAIEIGRIFREQESVYLYSSMLIERFLSGLSGEVAEHYHGLLFNENTDKLFNEEMLSTIDMFFKKDLNLSDTARQLYIHRNTLVYRLDKVQRQIGLNLRNFEDAVTFKLLMDMEKCKDNMSIEK